MQDYSKRRSYKGPGNPKWNGGIRINNGYRMLYRPEHPNQWQGYVYEHRIVVEAILGRYLEEKESVHHIDSDRQNNNPVNLIVFKNHSAHIRWTRHMKGITIRDIASGDVVYDGRKEAPCPAR